MTSDDARLSRLLELDQSIEHVAVTLRYIAKAWAQLGWPMFMGKPDCWYDKPHWRCTNNHVSTWYLKSEMKGALCPAGACDSVVWLTFPDDVEGPLPADLKVPTPHHLW